MKPAAFDYHAPATLDEALADLAMAGGDGKVLAGGQSLIPLLNMRLAAPGHLVDINGVAGLDTITVTPQGVRVGALARHAAVLGDDQAASAQPLLRMALKHVAHPVIRNRGTAVGSLAHADPAAELPAVLALLGGTMDLASATGRREVDAAEFFVGPLESALAEGEMAVSAFFPALPARAGTAFAEVSRRHGDYALVGVAGLVLLDDDQRIVSARVGCLSVAPTPLVLDLTEAAGPGDWAVAAEHARDLVEPDGDIHASAAYRSKLVQVLTERVLRDAAQAGGFGG